MKKFILILAIGLFLASCSSGWSCKKRYCDLQKKELVKKQLTETVSKEIIVTP